MQGLHHKLKAVTCSHYIHNTGEEKQPWFSILLMDNYTSAVSVNQTYSDDRAMKISRLEMSRPATEDVFRTFNISCVYIVVSPLLKI